MSLRLLEEAEADDPILSVVNLIDVFLVIIAALLLFATLALAVLLMAQIRKGVIAFRAWLART